MFFSMLARAFAIKYADSSFTVRRVAKVCIVNPSKAPVDGPSYIAKNNAFISLAKE